MESFTPFTARTRKRAEIKSREALRTPTAFLNAPLSHFPRLLGTRSAYRRQLGKDVWPPPARACVERWLAKSTMSFPSPAQGWLVK